jgi:hypothetical protein
LTLLLAVWLAGPATAAPAPERHAAYAPPGSRAPNVLTSKSVDRIRKEGTAALWVYFSDKGERDAASFARMVRSAGARMTEAARERRSLETGGQFVPDYYDVPVQQAYVDAVVSAGARIRNVSRWLNAVSIETDEASANRIASFPFVRIIVPVERSRRIHTVGEVLRGLPSSPTASPSGSLRDGDSPADRGAALDAARVPGLAPALDPPSGYGSSLAQLQSIGAKAAQDSGFTGANVIVAMFDTGFNKAHNATSQLKRLAERDFVFGDGETSNQVNDDPSAWDHGTGTWSVLGGYYPNNLIGPAYNATFLLAKTEDVRSETPVEMDNWMAAAEWADSIGARVISSSLAYLDFDPIGTFNAGDILYTNLDGNTSVVTKGAQFAQRRGILVANAMGNSGPAAASIWAPADADSILSVGAVDGSNSIASFSSLGPTADGRIKPEVVAQGVLTWWAEAGNIAAVGQANGTSLSTPLIGGIAAQVREAHPEWSADQVRRSLMLTADKAGTPGNTYGWGRPNAVSAIYTSTFGGPVYPMPFSLLSPANGALVTSVPVTFRWRKAPDPNPGDQVTYNIRVLTVLQNGVIFDRTTPDTFYTPANLRLGPNNYIWQVTAIDLANHRRVARESFLFTTSSATGVAVGGTPPAPEAVLYQNHPNPLFGATQIEYALGASRAASGGPVTLRIFDSQGRLVRTLLEGTAQAMSGTRQAVRWDGLDQSGRRVASGIYHYQLSVSGRIYSKRMIVLR